MVRVSPVRHGMVFNQCIATEQGPRLTKATQVANRDRIEYWEVTCWAALAGRRPTSRYRSAPTGRCTLPKSPYVASVRVGDFSLVWPP